MEEGEGEGEGEGGGDVTGDTKNGKGKEKEREREQTTNEEGWAGDMRKGEKEREIQEEENEEEDGTKRISSEGQRSLSPKKARHAAGHEFNKAKLKKTEGEVQDFPAGESQVAEGEPIRLDYLDEQGRVMTPKEAFRHLSHKFHGKAPSKGKQAKKEKRYAMETKIGDASGWNDDETSTSTTTTNNNIATNEEIPLESFQREYTRRRMRRSQGHTAYVVPQSTSSEKGKGLLPFFWFQL